jgi:endosialidase-like protein
MPTSSSLLALMVVALHLAAGLLAFPTGAAAQIPTPSLPFVAITPCRVVDTRGNGFAGAFGPPGLVAGVARTFPLAGQCGLPADAQAVSLNVTATNPLGPGFFLLHPAGGATPLVSTLNYLGGETVANAALVPLGAGGLTVIAGVSGSDLILDVNGYFATAGDWTLTGDLLLPEAASTTAGAVFKGATRFPHTTGLDNTFLGLDAGNLTETGEGNTGLGVRALQGNAGFSNTAVGFESLHSNTTGYSNTAVGHSALRDNLAGFGNVATGRDALRRNTAFNNVATGVSALAGNTTGFHNTAVGRAALAENGTGQQNTAVGAEALTASSGSRNTALGDQAGANLLTGNDNVYIAHLGVDGDSSTIRIGTAPAQNKAFVAGISGVSVTGAAVLVNGSGQLGVNTSSARYKEAIEPMGQASRAVLRLRPVTFRYRQPAADGSQPRQYGLIAEEVAEVYPELVADDADGQPQTVLYHVLPALLLNELQRQQRELTAQAAELAAKTRALEDLQRRIEALERAVTAGR